LTGCIPALAAFELLNTPSQPAISTVTISPQPAFIAAGASETFTATTTNANGTPVMWSANSYGVAPGATGTVTQTGNTVTYTAPSTPPIYNPLVAGDPPQGSVILYAVVTPDHATTGVATATFVITAPTVTVGISPTAAGVALGGTVAFSGYAVGNLNGAITWQVNGVTGGSMSYGTITQSGTWPYGGLYTAPAIMPITGPNVTITVISQADPTKTQTAVVTLH
jgi:hypothetical protein